MTAATAGAWERLFEPGLVDTLRSRYGDVLPNFDTIGKDCADFVKKKPVSNPNGLLVTRIRDAAARATRGVMSPADRRRIAEQGAEFAAQLYQLISEQGMTPNQIADYLDEGLRQGIAINSLVIDRLRDMGNRWPGR